MFSMTRQAFLILGVGLRFMTFDWTVSGTTRQMRQMKFMKTVANRTGIVMTDDNMIQYLAVSLPLKNKFNPQCRTATLKIVSPIAETAIHCFSVILTPMFLRVVTTARLNNPYAGNG